LAPAMSASNAADPSPAGRVLSACIGSTTVALVVTPLDVAKVRMQATAPAGQALPCCEVLQTCQLFFCSNGISEHCFDKRDPRWRHCFGTSGCPAASGAGTSASVPRQAAPGTLQTLRTIFAEGGVRGLYAGLPATMLIGIPSNVAYFSTYEAMRNQLQACGGALASAAPIVAGGASRAVAVTASAPLEVLRTRIQAGQLDGKSSGGVAREFCTMLRQEGLAVMFRGLQSTLWRDVPFSAFYWVGVEAVREALFQRRFCAESPLQVPATSLLASASAGAVAAFWTTPFDVVKTRLQVEVVSSPGQATSRTWAVFQRVLREEGLAALFAGAAPRTARVAPACAIMLGTYEMTKLLLQP